MTDLEIFHSQEHGKSDFTQGAWILEFQNLKYKALIDAKLKSILTGSAIKEFIFDYEFSFTECHSTVKMVFASRRKLS